jgi:SAM-dependent methyltransferase
MHAVDISPQVVEAARQGLYSPGVSDLVHEPVLERVTDEEMERIFDRDGSRLRVKSWLKEGISWDVGDAGDPRILDALGLQDIVVANRFLCHMDPGDAERCLRNVACLVRPGGHLFVSGIDLDVRTRVAMDLGWQPVRDAIEDIHGGDPSLTRSWPCRYWGLEPLDKTRRDWWVRYASVFQIG